MSMRFAMRFSNIWHVVCIRVWRVTFAYVTCLIYMVISGIRTYYMINSCEWHVPLMCVWPVPLMCVWPVTFTNVTCARDVSHSRLALEVVHEVWHTCKNTHSFVGITHLWSGTWLNFKGGNTLSTGGVQSSMPWILHMCDMTRLYMWRDQLIYVTCLIDVLDAFMTHYYVWHDAFICVTCLTHVLDSFTNH